MNVRSSLDPSSLSELPEQPVVGPQREVQRPRFVELWIPLEVLDDIWKKVGALHVAARRLVAQTCEMDVQVVVGRLVVQVDSQLAGWKVVALQDGLLKHIHTGVNTIL